MARRKREWADNNIFNDPVEPAPLPELNLVDVDKIGFGGQSLPIVRQDNGDVRLGDRFIVTTIGVLIDDMVTETEYWAFFDFLKKANDSIQWMIGDMVIHAEDKFGKDYDEIAKRTGYERETIKQYAHVARHIPALIRINAVDFAHCQVIAARIDSMDDKSTWLNWCAEHQLSVRMLSTAIDIWRNGGDPNEVFYLTESDKPTLMERTQMKMLTERERVRKKAKKKKDRQVWLQLARDEAEKWAKLAEDIKYLD